MGRKHKPPTKRLNATMYAIALEELAAGPTTRRELERHTGLSPKTVTAMVSALHKRRLIHVAAWEKDALDRYTLQAFQLGRKADAPKPAPKTPTELSRGYKQRKARAAALNAVATPRLTEEHLALSAQLGLAAFMRGLG